MFSDPLTQRLADFVCSIGIEVRPAVLDRQTTFPGLEINRGSVLVDEERLIHPGNILHEAGHIAVHPPERRPPPVFLPRRAEELSALAWSYAAVRVLNLKPELIFYPGSYQGWAPSLLENFAEGRYSGSHFTTLWHDCRRMSGSSWASRHITHDRWLRETNCSRSSPAAVSPMFSLL